VSHCIITDYPNRSVTDVAAVRSASHHADRVSRNHAVNKGICMSKTPPRKPAGRPVTDERGNQTWEWQADTKIDTALVRTLGEDLSLEPSAPPARSCDPYDRKSARPSAEDVGKGRTLDDMRRLSKKIKHTKYWKPDQE
jgi:hypothetical protein